MRRKGRLNSQVSPHDIFQHGTLSARLTADYDDLREIDGIVDADGCEDILELVHETGSKLALLPDNFHKRLRALVNAY